MRLTAKNFSYKTIFFNYKIKDFKFKGFHSDELLGKNKNLTSRITL